MDSVCGSPMSNSSRFLFWWSNGFLNLLDGFLFTFLTAAKPVRKKKKNPVLPVKRHNQWIKTLQHKTALPVCLTSHEESIASWYWWNSAAHWLYMRGPVANWLLNAKINLLILGCLQDSLIFDDLGQTLNIYLFIFLRFITTDSNKSHPSLTMRWVHAVTHYRCPSNSSDWPEDSEKVTLLPGVWV